MATHADTIRRGNQTSHGRLKNVLTTRAADAAMPEHLNVKYVEENSKTVEAWVSPEFQDYLKFTELDESGLKRVTLEAINISQP